MIRWSARVAALVVCASPVFAQPPDIKPAESKRPEAAQIKPADIDVAVMRHSLGQFWGGVVVGKGGKVIFAKGYGVADESLKPIEPDTLFDIGSISKQFTAAAILRLEMAGKLATTDPVAKFYPDFDGEAGERAKAITLHHLLTHTSGMSDRQAIQRLDFPDRDEAVRKALAAAPSGKVGEKFEYCNAGYVVLAAVIEKASGRTFEDYSREEVFKPAGLKNTGFLDGIGLNSAKQTLRVVVPRGGGRDRRVPLFASAAGEPWAWGLKGAGGVLTTMEDLVRWDAALRNDSVLSAAPRQRLTNPFKSGYALGWFVEPTSSGGLKVHHGGATRGFRAQLSRFMDEDMVIAVLTNESSDPVAIEKAILKAVLPGEGDAVELHLNLVGLSMNKWKAAEIDSGIVVSLTTDGNRLRLDATAEDKPFARVWLTKKATAALTDQLNQAMPAVEKGSPDGSAVMSTMPYQLNAEGMITLTTGLTCRAMPSYASADPETGQRTVDQRMTLVVMDEDRGFWPLILKLNDAAAIKLVQEFNQWRIANP